MEKIKFELWGISKIITAALGVENEEELTFDDLFKNYSGEIFHANPYELEPVGKEKW